MAPVDARGHDLIDGGGRGEVQWVELEAGQRPDVGRDAWQFQACRDQAECGGRS
ncbi:hypothetical protein ACWGJT_06990 [Streptomyces xantholiticus]